MRRKMDLPPELAGFEGRQRQLLEVIYGRGGATLREVYSDLPDPPASLSCLRTLLGRLARRGIVKKRPSGRNREFHYVPTFTNTEVQLSALRRIADLHFGGSRKNAVKALAQLASNEGRETAQNSAA